MKKKLLTFTFLLLTACIFSTTTFAQTEPGGEDDGVPAQDEGAGMAPISTFVYKSFTFKRNNGNGAGVCGINAQIRVVFDPMPPTVNDIPNLTGVLYKSSDLISGQYIAIDKKEIIAQTQPYVSYCVRGLVEVAGAHDGNIPPAEKLALKFNNDK